MKQTKQQIIEEQKRSIEYLNRKIDSLYSKGEYDDMVKEKDRRIRELEYEMKNAREVLQFFKGMVFVFKILTETQSQSDKESRENLNKEV